MSATGQPDNAIQMGFKPMLPGFDYAEYNNLEDFKSKVTENTIAIMIEPVQVKVVCILQHRNSLKDFVNYVMKKICCSCLMRFRQDGTYRSTDGVHGIWRETRCSDPWQKQSEAGMPLAAC